MKITLVYQDIAWREVGDGPTREKIWPRNETCPNPGEDRWMFTPRYINAAVGKNAWLLYQPGLSYFNGWVDHPKELDQSALIEVEILELLDPVWAREEDKKFFANHPDLAELREQMEASEKAFFNRPSPQEWRGWAKVRCQRAVPFAHIPESFPVAQADEHSEFHSGSGEEYQASSVTLHFNRHQEISEWWITTHGPPRYLVLYCLDISGDPIEVWNRLLPD